MKVGAAGAGAGAEAVGAEAAGAGASDATVEVCQRLLSEPAVERFGRQESPVRSSPLGSSLGRLLGTQRSLIVPGQRLSICSVVHSLIAFEAFTITSSGSGFEVLSTAPAFLVTSATPTLAPSEAA